MLLNNLTGSNPLTWAPVQYTDTPVVLGANSNTWSPLRPTEEIIVDNLVHCVYGINLGYLPKGCNRLNDNAVTCDANGNCIVKDDLKLFDGVWLKKAVTDTKAWSSKAATDAANWTSDAAKTVADKSEKVYNAVTGKYDEVVLPTSKLVKRSKKIEDWSWLDRSPEKIILENRTDREFLEAATAVLDKEALL